jgi:hypothetical protein
MRFHAIILFLLCLPHAIASAQEPFPVDQAGFQANAQSLLTTHCARCHSAEKAEGDFRIDQQLGLEFNRAAVAHKWDEVVNVLNSHEMPPEDEPQPKAEEVAKFIDWVREQQIRAEQFDRKAEVVLRRLNRNEYRNTIRDLIGVDFDVSPFPQDPSASGFDNNGRALSSSPLQVELYLAAARSILDEALVVGEQPQSITWRFEPESGDSDSNRVRYGTNNAIVNGGKNRREGDTIVMHHNSWDRNAQARDFKVPHKGIYTIRVRARSTVPSRDQVIAFATKALREQRKEEMEKHPERAKYIEMDLQRATDPYRTASHYEYGPGRLKLTVHLNGQPQILGEFDVDASDTDMKVYEFPVKMTKESAGISLEYAYEIPRDLENFAIQSHDEFPRPEVILDWFEIEGPVFDAWPPKSHQQVIPTTIPIQRTEQRTLAESVVRKFMSQAYRRPVNKEEVDAKMQLFDAAWNGESDELAFIEQLKVPLTAILVSPHFLYLAEPADAPESTKLDSFEFASRLSYFLWSSMPDAELFRAASKGELSQPASLIAQVNRMLSDPKSKSFVENFAGQWLGLRDVGANPPSKDLYSRYNDHVEQSIVKQSLSLFDDILSNDRDLLEFIDSDHEMLNEVLTRYYDLPPVRGDEMQRVALSSDSPRGGILTHASILTITSNGTRTSPVKRGTWVLKTILGTDPGLPVANAGDIAPKVPGIDKATVRQRLEIHRELAQCARCHNKIDPLGFALENFDAAGRYRTQEGFGYQGRVQENDPVIDASGLLPDGTKINGIEDLKAAILRDDAKFIRCITEKLFTYALGRELTRSDDRVIDQAVKTLNESRTRGEARTLRSLIHFIATSPTFANR